MTKILGIFETEGYSCEITEDADGRVHFLADADRDADGANGQNGGPPAYMAADSVTELSQMEGWKSTMAK